MKFEFASVEAVVEDLRHGKLIILVDDEDRENEGDLVMAAEKVTPEAVNFMARFGRGLICLSMTGSDLDRLKIPMMVEANRTRYGTAFTVSIEAATGVTTGISANDRARTIQSAVNPESQPKDLVTPGHIFPLRAREGGVLVRSGQTEGSVDLARLADLHPSGVICEIMNEDGSMSRMKDLIPFAKTHGLKILSINQLIAHRMRHENLVEEVASSRLPVGHAGAEASQPLAVTRRTSIPEDGNVLTVKVFKSKLDNQEHVALISGDIDPENSTLVRVHSECLTGDVFGSERCDCGWQLKVSQEMIMREGGVLLYMRQEGRGIGLTSKIQAYALQDDGLDTVEANERLGFKGDARDYGIGSQILRYLGIRKLKLLTNNPRKIYGLEGYGLHIVERLPIEMEPHSRNTHYLKTKKQKLGHLLSS